MEFIYFDLRPLCTTLVCGKKGFLEHVIKDMTTGSDKIYALWRGGRTKKGAKVLEISASKKTGGSDKGNHSTHPHKTEGYIGEYTIEIGMAVDATFELFT